MKKLLFYVSMLAAGIVSYGQVNYYDQDRNPITKGDCDIEALGVTVTIPEAVKNYEKISVSVIYAKNWASSDGYSVYEKMFDAGDLTPGSKDFWVKKPGGGSDFVSGGYGNPALDIHYPCSDVNRREPSFTLSVRLLGGTHSGWETVNDGYSSKTVKAYDYSVIATNDDTFTMEFGEVSGLASSKTGMLVAGLPFPDETDITTYEYRGGDPLDGPETIMLRYQDPEARKNDIIWVKIMAEKNDNMGDWTVDKVKNDIKQSLVYSTNYQSAWRSKFEKPAVKWDFEISTNKKWFYPGYAFKLGKSGDKTADAKFLAMKESAVDWTMKSGWHALEFDNTIFQGPELYDTNAKPYIGKDYVEAGKFLGYYVQDFGDTFIAMGIYKDYDDADDGGLSANEKKFIEKTFAGVSAK
jgi:hypothetical protein